MTKIMKLSNYYTILASISENIYLLSDSGIGTYYMMAPSYEV